MNKYSKFTLIYCGLVCSIAEAGSNQSVSFDLDFLHGISETPKVFSSTSGIVEGKYFTKIVVNNKEIGRRNFSISKQEEEADNICLTKEFLNEIGVKFQENIEKQFQNEACIDFRQLDYSSVTFNFSEQILSISIPQRYLLTQKEQQAYDYGINGARVDYNLRTTASSIGNESAFGRFTSKINIEKWVVNADFTGSWTDSSTDTNLASLYALRAIPIWGADFMVGKNHVGNSVLGSFSFGGVGLKTNDYMNRMKSNYIPHISGVVNSSARVTVKQNDRIIYAETLPPGPYLINDFSIFGFGDLVVEIKGDDGFSEVKTFPIITLPSLLRAQSFDYSLAAGKRYQGSGVDGLFDSDRNFIFAEGKYGFDAYTLESSVVLDDQFAAIGSGATFYLGGLGTFAIEGALSHAEYDDHRTITGSSVGLKYAYHVTSNTTVQLAAYKYQERDYVTYNEFKPEQERNTDHNKQKGRFELLMNSSYGRINTSLMAWQQTYWGTDDKDVGINASLNTYWADRISVGFNASYSDNRGREDYSGGVNISIPLSYFGYNHHLMTSISSSKNADTVYSTTASGQLSERLSYAMSVSDSNVNLSSNYLFDSINVHAGVNYNDGYSLFSAGASGGIAWTKPSGVLTYRHRGETVALIDTNGEGGLSVNNAITNDKGFAMVRLSPYSENRLNVDLSEVPLGVEVDSRQHTVNPVENAIVVGKINVRKVFRYIIRISSSNQDVIRSGDIYHGDLLVGSLSPNGMATLSSAETIGNIHLIMDKGGRKCNIDLSEIKPNERKVHEVVCN